MNDAPLNDYRDRLERDLAARRFGTRLRGTEDQVPRKLAYETAHPEVTFRPPCVHDPSWTGHTSTAAT